MAPTTRAKSAKAGAKGPNLKQTPMSKRYTKRLSHCGASVIRSKDLETALQDTSSAVANVSAAPLGSIDPQESATEPSPVVLPGWNGKRRRSGLPTKDELEVAAFLLTEDFRSRWASGSASDDELAAAATMLELKKDPNYFAPVQKASVDVLVAAATMMQMRKGPNYSAPVQKRSRPSCHQTRRGRRS